MPRGAVFVPFCYYEAAANKLTNPVLDPVREDSGIQVLRGPRDQRRDRARAFELWRRHPADKRAILTVPCLRRMMERVGLIVTWLLPCMAGSSLTSR